MNTPKSSFVSLNSTIAIEDNEKQHRTSPRVKAFDEVLALVSEYANTHKNSEKEVAALELKELFEDLAANPSVNKNEYNGRHYLGVDHKGNKVVFQHHCPPTERSHGKKYKIVCGPFRKKAVVDFMIETNANLIDVCYRM